MRWFRQPAGDPLAVSMCGVKLGDRLLVVGASDPSFVAAVAAKAGLTGRACLLDDAPDLEARAAQVEAEGALIEAFAAPPDALPLEAGTFDLVVFRHVVPRMAEARRAAAVREAWRVLRPGGRCIIIDNLGAQGLKRLVTGGGTAHGGDAAAAAALLQQAGFRGVRTLAEREALAFVEGVKAGTGEAGAAPS